MWIDPRCYRNRCHVWSLYWTSQSVRPEPPDELCDINYAIIELPTADIPIADDIIIPVDRTASGECDVSEQLQEIIFTFTDEFGGTLNAIKIITVPRFGYLTLDTDIVSPGDIILVPDDFIIGLHYHTDDTTQTAYDDEFLFQLKTVETEIYSNLATATINVSLCTNLGPVATDSTVPVDRISTVSCLVTEEYADGSIFEFTDADNDPLDSVKIMSLPIHGTLRYGQFTNIKVGDIIDFTESLFYISTSSIEIAYLDTVQFQVRTEHNGDFSNTATVTFDVTLCTNVNELPEAIDSTLNIDRLTEETCLVDTEYTESIFIYTDLEEDALNAVKIVTLPETGTLTIGMSTVIYVGDILIVPDDFNIYYHAEPTDQGSYTDTIQFQVRTDENTDFSNIATITIEVTECTETYEPCITYEPHFDMTSGGVGLLDVGILMSDTATIGDYVIEWRYGSITGELVLVSGSSYNIDIDINVVHPFDPPVVLAAGTYYPVLRWIEIDGLIYHSNPDLGDRFGEDLIECVDLIEVLQPVVVESLTCDNGTLVYGDYDHRIEYKNEDNPPESASASLTLDLNDDGSTKYLAWEFVGYTVSDKISFYYEDALGNRTLIESAIIGNDVASTDYTLEPIEINYFKFESAVNLKSFVYTFGDKVHIEIVPSVKQPSNKNTNWRLDLKCLGDVFECNYIDDDWRTIDPCTISGTWNIGACRLDVNFTTIVPLLAESYERTYLMPSSPYTLPLEANFNIEGAYRNTGSYGTCTNMADAITYTKSENTLTIDFEDSTTYGNWKTKYNSIIASLDSKGYTTDITNYAHYMYIRLYTWHGTDVDTVCGDSTSQSNISFHKSAIPVWDDINSIVTITQNDVIENGTTNYSCNNTYETITAYLTNMNAMINRIDGW